MKRKFKIPESKPNSSCLVCGFIKDVDSRDVGIGNPC